MKPTLLLLCLFALSMQANTQIIYVQQGATGSGSSWNDATGNLSEALEKATNGTQIWVAGGTYSPTAGTDRKATFKVPSGVQLFGGFSGTENSTDARNISAHVTLLTGEIGTPGPSDNSYTVVLLQHVDNSTVIDGFTISGGNANSEMVEGDRTRCGGAMFINGRGGVAEPIIRNCIFENNFGRDGAAVYNNGRNGVCNPTFENCIFRNNEAGLDGGAVYNDARMGGACSPSLVDCTFERNMGTYGGAICNASEAGSCNLLLTNCTFKENAAYLRGGALFSLNGDQKCYLEISDCQFSGNYPDDQNMVFTSSSARSEAFKIDRTEP